jgi:hypothetical protein
MMTRKIRGLAIFAFISVFAASAWGKTVMVSYDLVVDAPEDLQSSRYITETSIDVESGIMDELFDAGHIVFNAPGLVITDPSDLPEGSDQESNLARRRLLAANGGADTLIYLRLRFSGESEDELQLESLECEIFRLLSSQEQLASELIRYARPDAPPVDGYEASRILLNRIGGVDLF